VTRPRAAPEQRVRAWVSWSAGKDSALTLCLAQDDPLVEVAGLFTTVDEEPYQVAYTGVPVRLAEAQAAALGLPLHLLRIPPGCDGRTRETLRREVLTREAVPAGVAAILFGDAGGTDIRASRADRLAGLGIGAVFPLWGMDSRRLCRHILAAGIRAVITRLDPGLIDARWAGRPYDTIFLDALPPAADPCGEYGEFHTFTADGPGFAHPIPVTAAGITRRDGMVYAELAEADGRTGGKRRPA
jgi:diphthamide synthase (EF-2-diphthine--ammonia ligase)